jgi:hypothetical protein
MVAKDMAARIAGKKNNHRTEKPNSVELQIQSAFAAV